MRNTYRLVFLLTAFAVWFAGLGLSAPTLAQQPTYTVQKGDTLWTICEKYYGDPDLWPKLWKMNPFITNPHLLKPGDVLTLIEKAPAKEVSTAEAKKAKPETPVDKPKKTMGINVSGLTNVDTIGFLSINRLRPSGHIFSAQKERVVLSKGDIMYVAFDRGKQVNPGDSFSVYKQYGPLKDALKGKKLCFVISFSARIIVKQMVTEEDLKQIKGRVKALPNQNLYEAEIVKSYKEVHIGDPVMSYEPISPCVRPLPVGSDVSTRIIAVKDSHDLIGQWSVVYLEHGYDHGVRRGNVFEIMKKKRGDTAGRASYSDMVMGYLLILEARPDMATGVVVASKKEFAVGAFVSGLDWEKAQSVLSILPECPVE